MTRKKNCGEGIYVCRTYTNLRTSNVVMDTLGNEAWWVAGFAVDIFSIIVVVSCNLVGQDELVFIGCQ